MVSWSDSIWFFDIDDTLIDTAGTTEQASAAIFQVLLPHLGENGAQAVKQGFIDNFLLLVAGYRVKQDEDWQKVPGGAAAFHELLGEVERYQPTVIEKYGHAKKWSREILIQIALDKLGLKIPSHAIQEAADLYWLEIAEQAAILPGVTELFDKIYQQHRPVFFVTSSDARLQIQADGSFAYVPEYSESLKRQRVELLRTRGLEFRAVSIGDPEDKPHQDFFQKALRTAESDLGQVIDPQRCIMVGDSFAGDLETPLRKMNFGLVILVDKSHPKAELRETNFIITPNLIEVITLIK